MARRAEEDQLASARDVPSCKAAVGQNQEGRAIGKSEKKSSGMHTRSSIISSQGVSKARREKSDPDFTIEITMKARNVKSDRKGGSCCSSADEVRI